MEEQKPNDTPRPMVKKPILPGTVQTTEVVETTAPLPEVIDDAAPRSVLPGLSAEQEAALSTNTNRRVDAEAKSMTTPAKVDPVAAVQSRAAARQVGVDTSNRFIFMSRYPKLTTYVKKRPHEPEIKVEFKNGIFMTLDPEIAAGMRMHPRFGKLYREEKNINTAALRAEAARQRDDIRSPTFAGSTTSVDGNEHAFFGQDRTLSDLERRVIETGSIVE